MTRGAESAWPDGSTNYRITPIPTLVLPFLGYILHSEYISLMLFLWQYACCIFRLNTPSKQNRIIYFIYY